MADKDTLRVHYGDGTSERVTRFQVIPMANDTKQNVVVSTHTYAGAGIYNIYIEDPNRDAGILNIPGSDQVPMYLETRLEINPNFTNNSVSFIAPPITVANVGEPFVYNVAAIDSDADYLTFQFVNCKG